MMKNAIALMILMVAQIHAQNRIDFARLPFDMATLQRLAYGKEAVMPTFISGKFYYVNVKTGKKITDRGFEAAYPFVGRAAAIVKSGGKFGAVNRAGQFLAKPVYTSFQLWNDDLNEYVSFDNSNAHLFDLREGKYVQPGTVGCIDRNMETAGIRAFKGENQKYGISNFAGANYGNEKTMVQPIFDSVFVARANFFAAKKNGKIGIADEFSNVLIPFRYDDIIVSKPGDGFIPMVIGLKNKEGWEYYDFTNQPTLIVKSTFRCEHIGNILIANVLGIYENNGKYNILFRDGTSMAKSHDWISDNGTIATDGAKVYLIGGDALPFLYYEAL